MSDTLTPAAAIRAFGFSTAPATPAQPAPTTPPAPAGPLEPYPPADMRPDIGEQWIQFEKDNLAAGKITPEEANRRFDALGATPEQRAPDTRTAEVKLIDHHFPAAKPEEFLIRYGEPGQLHPPMTPELKQWDQSARTWLSAAEFSRELGNAFITEIDRTERATRGMTPDQEESYRMVEHAKMIRAYGGEDKLQEKLNAADDMIDQIEQQRPDLKAFRDKVLVTKGIGRNAMFWHMLIGQAEIYWARRKGR